MRRVRVLAIILLAIGCMTDVGVALNMQVRAAHLNQIAYDEASLSGYLRPVYQGIAASSDSPIREIEKTSNHLAHWANEISESAAQTRQDSVVIFAAQLALFVGGWLFLASRPPAVPS